MRRTESKLRRGRPGVFCRRWGESGARYVTVGDVTFVGEFRVCPGAWLLVYEPVLTRCRNPVAYTPDIIIPRATLF